MATALLLASVASLLLAAASLLWWELPLRLRQRGNLDRIRRLVTAGTPDPMPAQTYGELPTRPNASGTHRLLDAYHGLLIRAGLPASPTTSIALIAPSAMLGLVAWWRFPSSWLVLPCLGVALIGTALLLKRRIDRRRAQITLQLPGFLDDMVRMTSIGNSVPMAFSATYTSTEPPLRTILDTAMARVRSGGDLDEALAQASRPYHLESLEMLHVVMGISLRMGGRSDHILQRISHFLRDHERAQREFVATTAETRMSAWVIGLLPIVSSVILALLSPDFFNPLFTTSTGHHILFVALALELIGAGLLFKLAKSL